VIQRSHVSGRTLLVDRHRVTIRHDDKETTYYGLEAVSVRPGVEVKEGETVLGIRGEEGTSYITYNDDGYTVESMVHGVLQQVRPLPVAYYIVLSLVLVALALVVWISLRA